MSVTAEIIEKLRAEKLNIDSEIIKDLIAEHDTSLMSEGVRYYRSKGDITSRKLYYYDGNGKLVEDETKENHKLVNNWHKLLVDQKVSYLVGRPMVFSVEGSNAEEFTKYIELLLGEEWDDVIADIATGASNKGAEWLHVYIDRKGYFKYAAVPCEEIIPVYDTSSQENLEAALRYYVVCVNGVSRLRVEWWTRENVTVYIENDNGDFIHDDTEEENPAPHFRINGLDYKWDKVPFIEFPNNGFRAGDLEVTKSLIDEYDLGLSDFANNNSEVQEIITILKGYDGTDLAEFRNNLRYFKTIKISEGADKDVKKLELSIPVEAKKEMLDRLEENIFMFGQGVNMKTDKFGNAPSGVSLEFLYSLLDFKASMMERKFRKAIKRLVWFTTEYINLYFKTDFDSNCVKVKFRKNVVRNNKEIVETLKSSRDMITDEAIVSLHPMIENPTEEYMKLMEQRSEKAGKTVDLRKVDIYE